MAVRYWICNSVFATHIRVEHAGRTTMGRVERNGVRWTYDRPSDRIEHIVEACASSAGEWNVDGATYEGNETLAEMCKAVECTCAGCGRRVAEADELSTQGECGRCFVARQAAAS